MLSIILKAFHEVTKTLAHEWDTLVRRIGKRTADTLLIYMALALVLETFWFTLVLSIVGLAIFLQLME